MDSVTSVRDVVDADGYVIRVYDLCHRTDPEAAQAILASGRFVSRCQNPGDAYFTNMADGRNGRRYGDAVVHVQVPTAVAVPDERFNDGEVFYRVPIGELSRASIIDATGAKAGPRRPSPHESPRGATEERRKPATGATPPARGLTP